jgi:hypothetical protein
MNLVVISAEFLGREGVIMKFLPVMTREVGNLGGSWDEFGAVGEDLPRCFCAEILGNRWFINEELPIAKASRLAEIEPPHMDPTAWIAPQIFTRRAVG